MKDDYCNHLFLIKRLENIAGIILTNYTNQKELILLCKNIFIRKNISYLKNI